MTTEQLNGIMQSMKKKLKLLLLSVFTCILIVIIIIDNQKVHPPYEHILSYNKEREYDGVQWICVKEHGYTDFKYFQKELLPSIGYLPDDTLATSGYAYIIIYGGELIDIEYSNHTLSNWVLANLFGMNDKSAYGNVYVSQGKPEEVNVYRFAECPFEQDIHSADDGQLRIVSK